MKKGLLIFFIVYLQFTFIYSQNYVMTITMKDGSKVDYNLSDIFKIDFENATNVKDSREMSAIIKTFKLFQNYPNPFNPNTTIQYEIPKNGKVELNIYDVAGRHIKELVSKVHQAGNYKKIWDGKNTWGKRVSSGFYIYTLKFDKKLISKNMILIK